MGAIFVTPHPSERRTLMERIGLALTALHHYCVYQLVAVYSFSQLSSPIHRTAVGIVLRLEIVRFFRMIGLKMLIPELHTAMLFSPLFQTPTQYVRSNETSVMEYVQNLADTADIFLSHEGYSSSTPIPAPSVNGLGLKRRASDK